MSPSGNDGLIILDEVDSTQDEARRRLAAGAPSPVWVLAGRQRGGRGRKGRQWVSPPGNLHLSVALELAAPAGDLAQLSFIAAISAHKALCALAMRHGQPALQGLLALKWPNDLLLAERKLGGILLESESAATAPGEAAQGGQARHLVVIGWGINLASAPPDEKVRWPAVALEEAGLTVSPLEAAGLVRDYFRRWLSRWRAEGFAPVRAAWERRAWGLNREVAVRAGAAVHRGRLRGLAEDGALVLESRRGARLNIHAGEILPETAVQEEK
jgi:BirA family biotin operon repressor/biotin-[acetyl-CoA-carboxylase] ligase